MKKIILIGAGGHSKSCIEVMNQTKKYKIQFILDKKSEGTFLGYKKVIYNKKSIHWWSEVIGRNGKYWVLFLPYMLLECCQSSCKI